MRLIYQPKLNMNDATHWYTLNKDGMLRVLPNKDRKPVRLHSKVFSHGMITHGVFHSFIYPASTVQNILERHLGLTNKVIAEVYSISAIFDDETLV